MKVLITAGPTREPIDAVRYIGNRSSGQMGSALATAAKDAAHEVTLILGPVTAAVPPAPKRIDVQTAAEMMAAVLAEFPRNDLLVMAAAVADFRPIKTYDGKLTREGGLTIECEPTEDILSAVGRMKSPDQRTVGFSLETRGGVARSHEKLARKRLDLIVFNTTEAMNSGTIETVLIWPGGRTESLSPQSKSAFAARLIAEAARLFG